jgi:hypothetical protein
VVDPTGAEIKWDTVKAILELRQQDVIVDVMFNFMRNIQSHFRRALRRRPLETMLPKKTDVRSLHTEHQKRWIHRIHNVYLEKPTMALPLRPNTQRKRCTPPLGSKLQRTLQLGEQDRRNRPSKYHNRQAHHGVHNQQIQTPNRLHVNSYQ